MRPSSSITGTCPLGLSARYSERRGVAGGEVDLYVLVVEAELLRRPQDACGARARHAIDFQCHGRLPCDYLKPWPAASPARKMFGFRNIDSTSAPFGERAICRLPFGRHT